MNTTLCKIVGMVPTIYQRRSLTRLTSLIRGEVKATGSGAFIYESEPMTHEECEGALMEQAQFLAECEQEFMEMESEIKDAGVLYYDAAAVRIEEVTEY